DKGDAGPIYIPPFEKIEIARDGNISIRAVGQPTESLIEVNRIKLVNPPLDEIVKGADGFFRRKDGLIETPDASVGLVSGVLETSNVNSVDAMVQILSLARQFELSVKMMKTAEENDQTVQRLVQVS
ncbi:MAG: flagellar biosynthesis protein FlgF, partial [Chloroflexi bacterium]|nr:flagellar biosynthesis protein FlgF [Chloroflexota bacterium]